QNPRTNPWLGKSAFRASQSGDNRNLHSVVSTAKVCDAMAVWRPDRSSRMGRTRGLSQGQQCAVSDQLYIDVKCISCAPVPHESELVAIRREGRTSLDT